MTEDEKYYKIKMIYFKEILGIAHHKLTSMFKIFRDETLSPEEKLKIVEKLAFEYKKERQEHPDPVNS